MKVNPTLIVSEIKEGLRLNYLENLIEYSKKYDLKVKHLENLFFYSKEFDINLIKNEFLTYFLDLVLEENFDAVDYHFKFGKGSLKKIYDYASYLNVDIYNLEDNVIQSYIRNGGKVTVGADLTDLEFRSLNPEEILIRKGF